MGNNELKTVLINQKRPLDIAVQDKIAYLQSDHVFEDDAEVLSTPFVQPKAEDKDISFEEAFGMSQQSMGQRENIRLPQERQTSAVQKPMSIAQKIAMLRGAISTANSCGQYYKTK